MSVLLAQIGYIVDIVQISSGSLYGTFRIKKVGELAILHIYSSQSLIFFGDYRPEFITLAFDEGGNREDSRAQGEVLPLHSIAGYGLNKKEVFYSSSVGSSMYFVLIPSIYFQGLVHQLSRDKVLRVLNQTNLLRIATGHFFHLRDVCRGYFRETPESDTISVAAHDLLVLIHDIMASNCIPMKNIQPPDYQLTREFLRLVFENCLDQPITISDLTQRLFTTKTSLSTQIRKSTGLSPIAFLRYARLEQVRSALIRNKGQVSVGAVAKQYGFSSRSHFARHYQDLFRERPTDTLLYC